METKRELRRVSPNWKHPVQRTYHGRDEFKPLFGHSYNKQCEQCGREFLQEGEVLSARTTESDHMPEWPNDEKTGYQMYETETAGTPVSPVFPSTESLVDWLVRHEISLVGSFPGTREEWNELIALKNW